MISFAHSLYREGEALDPAEGTPLGHPDPANQQDEVEVDMVTDVGGVRHTSKVTMAGRTVHIHPGSHGAPGLSPTRTDPRNTAATGKPGFPSGSGGVAEEIGKPSRQRVRRVPAMRHQGGVQDRF